VGRLAFAVGGGLLLWWLPLGVSPFDPVAYLIAPRGVTSVIPAEDQDERSAHSNHLVGDTGHEQPGDPHHELPAVVGAVPLAAGQADGPAVRTADAGGGVGTALAERDAGRPVG
jgi:hypothetical protein